MNTPKPSLLPALALSFAAASFAFCATAFANSEPAVPAAPAAATAAAAEDTISPEQALKLLSAGNARFVAGANISQVRHLQKRDENAKGQKPFAIVLCCSDSRVPPEVVFDQGIGDIFVVRTAGHVVDNATLGSIEYGAEHLGASIIIVLGHERCGAVSAVCAGGEAPGHIATLINAIKPAAEFVDKQPGDKVENTVRSNIKWTVVKLSTSEPLLAHLVQSGKLKIQGAYYDLDTGKVEWVN